MGLGFRLWGLGLWASGLLFGVLGLGCWGLWKGHEGAEFQRVVQGSCRLGLGVLVWGL